METATIPANNRYKDEGVNEDVNLFPGARLNESCLDSRLCAHKALGSKSLRVSEED